MSGKEKRICPTCQKAFFPIRFDQTCCSRACRAKQPRTTYPKYDAAAAKAERLALIKALASGKVSTFKPRPEASGLEGISEFAQAQREASRE